MRTILFLFLVPFLIGFPVGYLVGWVSRFRAERTKLAEWRALREARNNGDDVAVLRWLEENGATTPETLIAQVDRSPNRVRYALDRLERDGLIRGGFPQDGDPTQLVYWRDWKEPNVNPGQCQRFCGRTECTQRGCQGQSRAVATAYDPVSAEWVQERLRNGYPPESDPDDANA